MKQKKCIFCQIIAGKVPAYKIYEDDSILAFLDINPFTRGHTVVASKKHYRDIFDVPQDEVKKTILVAQKIAKMTKKKLGAKGINFLHDSRKAGEQFIFHFHFHVIPRYPKDGLSIWPTHRCKNCNLKETQKKLTK